MNFRKLHYFCVVAAEGSISKAAERLFVAQPALSRQISELEEEIGTPLLHRLARGISLTTAGKIFLEDAGKLLTQLSQAKERANLASRGKIGSLTIGLIEYFSWHLSIVQPIRLFREENQDVSMQLSTWEASLEIQQRILESELDCGFGFNRPKEDSQLQGLPVLSVNFLLAVPGNSPLAARTSVRMTELANEPFVWIPREIAPKHYDRCLMICNKAGFSPRITQTATTESGRLSLVAAGVGCAIITSAAALWKPEQVALLTLEDVDLEIDLELIWRTDNKSPILANFISAVQRSIS
jgi:DNA-binding transcriptional LysR family regulator